MKKRLRQLSFLAAFLLLLAGCTPKVPAASTPAATEPSASATAPVHTDPPPTTDSSWQTDPPTAPEAPEKTYVLSFAGDCTLGDDIKWEFGPGSFRDVVKNRFDYPFSNVKDIFASDDYTIVNLEGTFTECVPTDEEMETLKDKRFRFRGPASYAKILVEGSVEFASVANNHARDFGQQGLYDTWKALEAENIAYASYGKTCSVTTESGLKLGIIAISFNTDRAAMERYVQELKAGGAEIIILSIHWGDEKSYWPTDRQVELGHMAIDAGVNIVFGHHTHTLLPVESYRGGIIYYSLGNFSFGGNGNPSDKDTAILQQQILRMADGSLVLGDLNVIPCRVSAVPGYNDYRPTPYDPEDPGYDRVISKLDGTFEDYKVKLPG